MELKHIRIFIFCLSIVCPVYANVLRVQKRDWINGPSASIAEGDVECFSEYMELWIHRIRIEGLRLWLSAMLRIQVSLTSLESLNRQLSACGFGLHKDPDRNYIFRVMYSGCFVLLEHDHYVIALNLQKRISRFGGRTHNYVMKCPVVASPPNREHIQCDLDFIQVTRQIPVDSWNSELSWSLALSGSLVVALEDASLIQVNVNMQKSDITIQGRRNTVLSPVQVLQTEGHFLPLKLVSGHYAYSMEATCPSVMELPSQDTVLHIYKRRMGLTKRGGYDNETLTVSSVSVNQTDTFTWSESSGFVQLVIPTALILKKKKCSDKEGENLQQDFYRIDVVLSFKETNNKMLWTMENFSPCTETQNSSAEIDPHPSVTAKPSLTFTAQHTPLITTLSNTEVPLFSPEVSNRNREKLSQTTAEGLNKATTVSPVSSVSSSITTLEETDLNITSLLLADTGKLQKFNASVDPKASTYVPFEENMESDTSTSSSKAPSTSHAKEVLDFPATETSTLPPYELSKSIKDKLISTVTVNNFRKAVYFTSAPFHTEKGDVTVKWNPVWSSSSAESTSALSSERTTFPKTLLDVTLNTPLVSLKPLQLNQGPTPASLTPQANSLVDSMDTNPAAQIHTPVKELIAK